MSQIEDFNNEILMNHGGLSKNNLLNYTNGEPDDENENSDTSLIETLGSSYFSIEKLGNVLKMDTLTFSILSLNCQSLNAKFDNLCLFLASLHPYEFSAICLQETWLPSEADLSLFQIANYTLIKGKNVANMVD